MAFLLATNLGLAFGDVIVVSVRAVKVHSGPPTCAGTRRGRRPCRHTHPVLHPMQDAIVVNIARGEPAERAGSLQSLCWGSRVSEL